MFPPAGPAGGQANRSSFEKFAVPYMFQPELGLRDAAFAVLAALVRIFSGSLLFGVWGTCTLLLWERYRSPLARLAIGAASLAGFLAAFAALMISINLLLKKFRRQG